MPTDGEETMRCLFVEPGLLREEDFKRAWSDTLVRDCSQELKTPFLILIFQRWAIPVEQSLNLVSKKARAPIIEIEKYGIEETPGFLLCLRFAKDGVCSRLKKSAGACW
jgi:hypothetical protein